MPFEDAKSHLRDILESIERIEEFIQGMDFESFRFDSKTKAAVERKMLIISEAAIRLKGSAEGSAIGCVTGTIAWRSKRSGTQFSRICPR